MALLGPGNREYHFHQHLNGIRSTRRFSAFLSMCAIDLAVRLVFGITGKIPMRTQKRGAYIEQIDHTHQAVIRCRCDWKRVWRRHRSISYRTSSTTTECLCAGAWTRALARQISEQLLEGHLGAEVYRTYTNAAEIFRI